VTLLEASHDFGGHRIPQRQTTATLRDVNGGPCFGTTNVT
jgi:hypothetical protein